MQLSPLQSLALVVLIGLAASGWLYGVHWKRVAEGTGFTKQEQVMIRLQDQIETLTKKNEELNATLRELGEEPDENGDPPAPAATEPTYSEPVELPEK